MEGQVALLADLRWRRPSGLHRARSDGVGGWFRRGSGRQMCSVLEFGVETAAPSLGSLYGGDQAMLLPPRQRAAAHRCPRPLGTGWRVSFSLVAGWARCVEAGLAVCSPHPGNHCGPEPGLGGGRGWWPGFSPGPQLSGCTIAAKY